MSPHFSRHASKQGLHTRVDGFLIINFLFEWQFIQQMIWNEHIVNLQSFHFCISEIKVSVFLGKLFKLEKKNDAMCEF